ncbi:MAG: Gfo/Idh/MocA family oxidoreductase [Planctomycetes bacterium]|nr:Gfo/Idh/MocA family oxidoreductase [Planctomycetota bacterium]
MGRKGLKAPVRCAVVGYGAAHIFGRAHGRWIDATPDLEWAAVCDRDPERLDAAKEEFPQLETYESVTDMLSRADIDLISIVTPHFTHAPISIECMKAGRHVICDKAMCLSVAEADAMIDAAEKNDVMLAIFHARRHDGNFRAIKEAVHSGQIGDVFHIELTAGGYGRPRDWWYSKKALGGGAFYYWGPHAIDWVLDLVRERIKGVTGFYHKRVWHDIDQEDQVRAIMLFENGCVADVSHSHIAAIGKPLWRILGTKGAILDTGSGGNKGYQEQIAGPSGGSFQMVQIGDDGRKSVDVPYKESDWLTYYMEIADHLLRDGPVPVTGEDGRRTIAVFEAAEKSSKTGKTEAVAYE